MRGIFFVGLICALGAGIASCADPNTAPRHIVFADSQDTLVMGPNLRLVSQRAREIEGRGFLPTICTEPSPDVAIAFNRTYKGEGTITPPTGGTAVSGNATVELNEQATELKGREAGVLALRDGLYAACQSYVNGVLGHDAYAIILSQYGNLLVALTGTASSGTRTAYSAEESAVAALFVACVSEYDPTRLYPTSYRGKPILNPMLSPRRCHMLLDNIARGTFVMAAKSKPKPQTPTQPKKPGADNRTETKPAPGSKVTKTQKTVTKMVTESTAPPAADNKP